MTCSTWTINDMNSLTIDIGTKGNFKSDFDKVMEGAGLPPGATFKFTGDQEGTFIVDASNGWINNADITVDIHGAIDIPASANMPQDMSIPMEIRSVNNYKMERL